MKTAVFIGGPFDMAKMQVKQRERYVYFYEPVENNPVSISDEAPRAIMCKKLRYSLFSISQSGVLVYEFDGAQ